MKFDLGKIKKILTNAIFQLILLFFAAWVIFPVLWGVSTSLRTFEGIYQVSDQLTLHDSATAGTVAAQGFLAKAEYRLQAGGRLLRALIPPTPIQWRNYVEAWKKGNFNKYFLNSFFYMVTVVLFMLLLSSMAAYAFARLRFPGKEFIFYLFLASLVMPLPTIFITVYLLLQNFPIYLFVVPIISASLLIVSAGSLRRIMFSGLGILLAAGAMRAILPQGYWLIKFLHIKINLLDTRTGYILPQIASGLPYTIFLMRSFFEAIPVDLEDAARIDGCSRLGIYFRIILPLSRPILAVTGIFGALSVWKEFLFAVVVFSDNAKMPIQAGLLAFQGTYRTQWNYLMAGVIITVIPVIIVYLLLQKHVISGLTAGAVKG
ncbi:MAG: carbohydrate ABC transporter permease [Elusimicrobia bacterium]|nr:carbohydrate ABC transporter permease [Elusimicrobiota bacterium]